MDGQGDSYIYNKENACPASTTICKDCRKSGRFMPCLDFPKR